MLHPSRISSPHHLAFCSYASWLIHELWDEFIALLFSTWKTTSYDKALRFYSSVQHTYCVCTLIYYSISITRCKKTRQQNISYTFELSVILIVCWRTFKSNIHAPDRHIMSIMSVTMSLESHILVHFFWKFKIFSERFVGLYCLFLFLALRCY